MVGREFRCCVVTNIKCPLVHLKRGLVKGLKFISPQDPTTPGDVLMSGHINDHWNAPRQYRIFEIDGYKFVEIIKGIDYSESHNSFRTG